MLDFAQVDVWYGFSLSPKPSKLKLVHQSTVCFIELNKMLKAFVKYLKSKEKLFTCPLSNIVSSTQFLKTFLTKVVKVTGSIY